MTNRFERGGWEKAAVEGKIGAEVGEPFRHFGGAAVGVEEEAAGGALHAAEQIVEETEGVEAVDRSGQVAFGGEGELPKKNLRLLLDRCAAEAGEARVVGAGA